LNAEDMLVHFVFLWVETSVISIVISIVINDFGVAVDNMMTFVNHIVSKLARMLGFIKRISRKFNDSYTYNKTMYVAFFRPGLV
jgi:hypothetical protein